MPKKTRMVDRKTLSFFILGFPTLLIIALAMITPEAWWAMILLAIYQFILLKQYLDDYYGNWDGK